jgi:acyl carrier protein
MTAEQKLQNFVVAELRWRGSRAEMSEASLIDVLDSLAIMKTVAFIEDEFKIKIDDDEIVPRNFATLPVLAAFVNAKRAS